APQVLRGALEAAAREQNVVIVEGGGRRRDACEVGLILGPDLLLAGDVAGAGRDKRLVDGGRGPAQQRGRADQAAADQPAVAAGELAKLVPRRRWARRDRLVVEVAANVGRELGRRLVPAGGLLFEGLGGDGLEVAAQRAIERA